MVVSSFATSRPTGTDGRRRSSPAAGAQPTLLIVGERDPVVVRPNERARRLLGGGARLAVVSGATHLFEERGALEQVAGLARDWFLAHLRSAKWSAAELHRCKILLSRRGGSAEPPCCRA
jgi:pimeloyl-ACP methyl ester carboxylesterase